MIGKLIGAKIGEKLAGRHEGGKGALIGFLAPIVARRAMGPLGLALAGGWVAKKIWDRRKARQAEAAAPVAVAPATT